MSSKLLGHVWDLNLPDHATKLVLLRLADSANDETGECWPSLKHIQDKCNIKSKNTIRRALEVLEQLGLIVVIKRKLNASQNTSNLYRLNIKKILNPTPELGGSNSELGGSNSELGGSNSELGGGSNSELGGSNSELGGGSNSEPRTNNSFEPINELNTTLTGSNTRAKKKQTVFDLLAEFGITDQLAEDFITHRKACKATITKTALDGFQREADKAGIPIQEAVAISIERGWRGFKASWDWQGNGQQRGREPKSNLNKPWNTPEAWAEAF